MPRTDIGAIIMEVASEVERRRIDRRPMIGDIGLALDLVVAQVRDARGCYSNGDDDELRCCVVRAMAEGVLLLQEFGVPRS